MIILITGLPGSGKTTLAKALANKVASTIHFEADEVRKEFDDWDFSVEGRRRQAERMRQLALDARSDHVILDFVCPTNELRRVVNADYVIWMDTISEGRYADTNDLFEAPDRWDTRIASHWSGVVDEVIIGLQEKIG